MARVGLKGAWLEAARLSRHRAHSLLSRVFVATKERTCVLLCDVSSSSSSSSNDNPPNDEWTERIIIPWKREEEERRQRHLHHLFVCVIFFISFHLQCVSASEWVCFCRFVCHHRVSLSPLLVKWSQCVCIYCACLCVCASSFDSPLWNKKKKKTFSLSLSRSTLCVCVVWIVTQKVFFDWDYLLHCVSSSREFSHFQCFRDTLAVTVQSLLVWPPSLIIITIWWFQVCVHRPLETCLVHCVPGKRKEKREEEEGGGAVGFTHPTHTHPKSPTAAAEQHLDSLPSPICPLGKRKVSTTTTKAFFKLITKQSREL